MNERYMQLNDFDYELPERLIAQEPLPRRDASRLMVVDRASQSVSHRRFSDLLDYLRPGDLMVVNHTKVLPVRLWGEKSGTGGRVEVLLLHPTGPDRWECLVRPGRRLPPGTTLTFGDGLTGEVVDRTASGGREIIFAYEGSFETVLARLGQVPLPPYIRKPLADADRYQTVYATDPGSAAAPTAGMHFTPTMLELIRRRGVTIVPVLLHIGLDTFRPVRVEEITKHEMHSEYYQVPEETGREVTRAKRDGRRVIAVGTTSTRCLESAADADGQVRAGEGWTRLFIYPGYRFTVVDAMVTNFHLPKSTLLMMISAFAGRELILRAYAEAVRQEYRFFSLGDAMLIL